MRFRLDPLSRNGISLVGDERIIVQKGSGAVHTGAKILSDLTNVDTAGATDNQALSYDLATNKWIPQTVAGGGGAVDSVNGQTGTVVLDADDIDDTTTANKFVTATDITKLSNLSGTNTGDQDLSGYATTASLATVATTGAYSDLTGTPTIPTALADLSDDTTHRVVTDTEKSTWNAKSDFDGAYSSLSGTPTLGTAAAKNIPATGDASATEVVYGTDTRLTDARTPASHGNEAHTSTFITAGDIPAIPTSVDDLSPSQTGNSGKYLTTDGTNASWATVSGSGDVVGPASATDNAVARFDTTTGKLIQDSRLTITDGGSVTLSFVGGELVEFIDGQIYTNQNIIADSTIKTNAGFVGDSLVENTLNAGVTIDGVLVKDGLVDGRDVSVDGSKLDGIEAGADVTDTTNVTAAGALMDSEVDADIKTLSLPANTTISTFGASLIDDAAASNARTTLGLGSLSTASSVNNSNWSGTDLSVSNGGTGASTLASGNFLQGNGTSAVTATKAVPSGAVVGTSDTQTLTNKDLSSSTNTFPDFYPVGTLYTNETNPANPSTYLPGQSASTWVARTDVFIVARGPTYTGTGGSATHSHTLAAGHAYVHNRGTNPALILKEKSVDSWSATDAIQAAGQSASSSYTGAAMLGGSTDSDSNIPPYQAVYAWVRTA